MKYGNEGEGERTNGELIENFSESYFILVKHKRHREDVYVQNLKDKKL